MIGAALITNLLPAAAFLAVFVAGLFARSVLEHELEIWHRTHPRKRPPAPPSHPTRDGGRTLHELRTGHAWPMRDQDTVRREVAALNAELETVVGVT